MNLTDLKGLYAGIDDAEIIAGAGRANKTWTNGIVALGVPVGAVNSAIKHDKLENMCGCQ